VLSGFAFLPWHRLFFSGVTCFTWFSFYVILVLLWAFIFCSSLSKQLTKCFCLTPVSAPPPRVFTRLFFLTVTCARLFFFLSVPFSFWVFLHPCFSRLVPGLRILEVLVSYSEPWAVLRSGCHQGVWLFRHPFLCCKNPCFFPGNFGQTFPHCKPTYGEGRSPRIVKIRCLSGSHSFPPGVRQLLTFRLSGPSTLLSL